MCEIALVVLLEYTARAISAHTFLLHTLMWLLMFGWQVLLLELFLIAGHLFLSSLSSWLDCFPGLILKLFMFVQKMLSLEEAAIGTNFAGIIVTASTLTGLVTMTLFNVFS